MKVTIDDYRAWRLASLPMRISHTSHCDAATHCRRLMACVCGYETRHLLAALGGSN